MTKEQAIKELNALTDDDPETAHIRADEILLERLKALGFWYA